MSYGQDCTVSKLRPDSFLYEVVGFYVDGRRGFVQYQDARLSQQCSCKANELPLANAAKEKLLEKIGLPVARDVSLILTWCSV